MFKVTSILININDESIIDLNCKINKSKNVKWNILLSCNGSRLGNLKVLKTRYTTVSTQDCTCQDSCGLFNDHY